MPGFISVSSMKFMTQILPDNSHYNMTNAIRKNEIYHFCNMTVESPYSFYLCDSKIKKDEKSDVIRSSSFSTIMWRI